MGSAQGTWPVGYEDTGAVNLHSKLAAAVLDTVFSMQKATFATMLKSCWSAHKSSTLVSLSKWTGGSKHESLEPYVSLRHVLVSAVIESTNILRLNEAMQCMQSANPGCQSLEHLKPPPAAAAV